MILPSLLAFTSALLLFWSSIQAAPVEKAVEETSFQWKPGKPDCHPERQGSLLTTFDCLMAAQELERRYADPAPTRRLWYMTHGRIRGRTFVKAPIPITHGKCVLVVYYSMSKETESSATIIHAHAFSNDARDVAHECIGPRKGNGGMFYEQFGGPAYYVQFYELEHPPAPSYQALSRLDNTTVAVVELPVA